MRCFDGVAEAYQAACEEAEAEAEEGAEAKEGLVIVAGSFHTVAAARMLAKC